MKSKVEKAVETINSTIEEIKKGLENSNLTPEAAARLKKDAFQIELKVRQTKINLQKHITKNGSPASGE